MNLADQIAYTLMQAAEYNKLAENDACHQLPSGVKAGMQGNDAWREPSHCMMQHDGPPPRDAVLGSPKSREDMLRIAAVQNLLRMAIPDDGKTMTRVLRDSLSETQRVNMQNRLDGRRAPFMMMLNHRW